MSFEVERLEKTRDQQTRIVSKTRLVEQVNLCLRTGDYSRALDLLRGASAELPNDAELSELEKRAQDGLRRKSEADRLITESQGLFAQQKSAEAIELLRQAFELDKNNPLARAILANALVEHAQSMVESDWLKAETLTNQALALNPAHPTAKTILSLIVEQKKASSVDDWVSQARKLQSSGDLFAALAWVAEGLAVHPEDPKLLQLQDAIQRDQSARRRRARRGDLEDLRRMELEIDGAADVAAKQVLAERIQAMAAKYWTDGEILSIANALLHRLGLAPQQSSVRSPQSKGATVIFHVPRPGAPEASVAPASRLPQGLVVPNQVLPSGIPAKKVPLKPAVEVPTDIVPSSEVPPGIVTPDKVPSVSPEPQLSRAQTATVSADEAIAARSRIAALSSQSKQPRRSNSKILILAPIAAIILCAAVFFIVRKHHSAPVTKTAAATPIVSVPAVTVPTASAPAVSTAPVSSPAELTPERSLSASRLTPDAGTGEAPLDDQPPTESGHKFGTLVVVAGQDDARVFLNGKLQRQLTEAGQLRLPNLAPNNYSVQVSKSGFQDPPQQEVRIRKGEQAKLIFNLQPQPLLASLIIQGGAAGTKVLVDQSPVGTIQPDGRFSLASINPGDHTVELRKDGFKPRQFKRHFIVGGAISLIAADAALEAAAGELKISFSPADAKVAIAKAGELPTVVSSGVRLNLAPGTYTLTARTAERFTRSSTLEIIAGQSKTLDLSLAPNGMSKFDDPSAWKQEAGSFIRKSGDFVLYGVVPTPGTFAFSAMATKGHLLQWVLNYKDSQNYVLFQMDENNFYRAVIRDGRKSDEIKVADKGDKKSFRALHIRVSPTEIVHQIRHGDSWTVLDRWTQPGTNLSQGKFGFYIPGNDQVAVSSFAQYVDLNTR